ncbi:MAG: two-component sensor histidine kinase [Legionellales bacterium]|nr:two-component sensor histidine kinase [Legionellales bacterium]
MLPQNDWLNITATIVPTSFGLQSFLFSLEIIVAVAVIFFLWTINRFTKPLHKFTKAAERLGVDLHSEPLPIYGPVAVRATATAMNKMQERIQDLIQARTQMLAAISHDLRTPITRLKLRTQYLDEGELQQKIIKDLDEMEAMISETLAFAREDSRSEQRVNLDIVSMLASLCEDFADTGQDVQYIGPQTRVLINGGSVSLRRVFTNVIDNACKYAGSVTVDLHAEGDEVHILFDDNGPGIANAQLDKVFMPFYRGEHSRSRETGGTGLGLATARDIIRAHGGDIRLSNRPSGGLRVTVVLPG